MGEPIFPSAMQAGAEAGGPPKPKLIQIGQEFASLKDVIRIYTDSHFNSQGEPIYSIIFRYFKGYEFQEAYSWPGEEGRTFRDSEYADLKGRLEEHGFQIM